MKSSDASAHHRGSKQRRSAALASRQQRQKAWQQSLAGSSAGARSRLACKIRISGRRYGGGGEKRKASRENESSAAIENGALSEKWRNNGSNIISGNGISGSSGSCKAG
jgi:hypothetical protein